MQLRKLALLAIVIAGAAVIGWMLHASAHAQAVPQLPARTVAATNAAPGTSSAGPGDQADRRPPVYITIVGDDAARKISAVPARAEAAVRRSLLPASYPRRRAPALAPGAPPPGPGATTVNAPDVVGGMSIVANGDRIVIANDGSIVLVGDNGEIRGNTGDASSSGTIGVDLDGSQISSGNSDVTSVMPPYRPVAPALGQPSVQPGMATYPADKMALRNGALGAAGVAGTGARRAIGIAGYEDHSLDIGGDDNILTYDDSNVFFRRIGKLNGNTGDTDTSGLNVVDATRSTVRSGGSGNSDESPDPPPFDPSRMGTAPAGGLAPGYAGGPSVSVADINGVSSATGDDALVIGGDGMDDNGVRVRGDRNIATYDDGNVAVGGIGDMNAQIGDSDTAGTVAMGIVDSHVEAGGSFLPASQQAGAQPADPFDGDDPDVSPGLNANAP